MGEVLKIDFKNKKLVSKDIVEFEPTQDDLEKCEYFAELLKRGKTQVLVNSLHEGVSVPDFLRGNPALPIAWSYNFGSKDMNFDSKCVKGTLHFQSKPFFVELPWQSVWMIYRPEEGQDSSKIWKKSAPPGLLDIVDPAGGTTAS